MRPAVLAVATASLVALTVATGCRDDRVRVTFRPEVGDTYRYETTVSSRTSLSLEGLPVDVRGEDAVLVAEHTVVAADDDGVRVQVVLSTEGEDDRTFVVRFDRAAQLEAVERIEGLPEEALGQFGLSEIFPTAAGAPPDKRLAPGETWEIDEDVTLPDIEGGARLRGDGRLEELGIVDGEEAARLHVSSRVPLAATTITDQGPLELDGVQESESSATHDLDDGAVRRASARTVGRYRIELSPPPGQVADPVPGELTVEVRSETRRLD